MMLTIQIIPKVLDRGELFSPEEMYLYALVGVSALCLVILVALIAVSVGLCIANSRYTGWSTWSDGRFGWLS